MIRLLSNTDVCCVLSQTKLEVLPCVTILRCCLFGTTTELRLRVVAARDGAWQREAVQELARNNPSVIPCQACSLVRYANLVGQENVIAGTDCGLGGRFPPEIVWAKFQALAEVARLATQRLWGR